MSFSKRTGKYIMEFSYTGTPTGNANELYKLRTVNEALLRIMLIQFGGGRDVCIKRGRLRRYGIIL